jgi:hypothetical protein
MAGNPLRYTGSPKFAVYYVHRYPALFDEVEQGARLFPPLFLLACSRNTISYAECHNLAAILDQIDEIPASKVRVH